MAANNLFETCGNANERRMLLNDKNDIFNKLEKLLNQYYELEESIVNEFEEEVNDNLEENKDNVEVIYLTKGHNGEGNVVFLDYLKGIPFEYYGKLLSMLESIYKKSNTDNLANNKVLVGALKGLWERKAFKLRIY